MKKTIILAAVVLVGALLGVAARSYYAAHAPATGSTDTTGT